MNTSVPDNLEVPIQAGEANSTARLESHEEYARRLVKIALDGESSDTSIAPVIPITEAPSYRPYQQTIEDSSKLATKPASVDSEGKVVSMAKYRRIQKAQARLDEVLLEASLAEDLAQQ